MVFIVVLCLGLNSCLIFGVKLLLCIVWVIGNNLGLEVGIIGCMV